jgi:two-component system LytT family response regulator
MHPRATSSDRVTNERHDCRVPEPPLRVLVAADAPLARRRVARLLGELPDVAVVAACASDREVVELARTRCPDVVFLDVAIAGAPDLDVARRIAAHGDPAPLVVILSPSESHAFAAYRARAADYLLTPLDPERLAESIAHLRATARGRTWSAARLVVRDGRRTRFVHLVDIHWIQSFGNYALVHTARERLIHRATMTQLAEELAPHGFVRTHRAAIVNLDRVASVRRLPNGASEARLDTGARVPVSRHAHHRIGRLASPPNGCPSTR